MTGARATALLLLLTPGVARAHFVLQAPAAVNQQGSLGDPQKAPPCGADGTETATGTVSPFAPGETITITVNETITHPGHYRVALSTTGPAGLPAEPPVTAGSTACGSTTIMNPPVFPVLADGQLLHTAAFGAPQSFQVTLPTNVTCTKCTLQVIEFMSEHGLNVPGGCFYHHCADISIGAAAPDGGGASDAGKPGGSDSGCGCALAEGPRLGWAALAIAAAAIVRRRRR